MKKEVFIILGIILVIVIGVIVFSLYNKEDRSDRGFYAEIYSQYSNVDDGTEKIMSSEEYKALSEEEKVTTMEQFLKMYQSAGAIKNLYYDSSNQLFSFEYASGDLDGALGGVMLKEFDPMMN